MKLANCKKLSQHPLSGHWDRAVNLRHYHSRLSTDHTKVVESRFSPATPTEPLHRILYLAENHQVAMYEVQALFGPPAYPLSDPRASWLILSLQVRMGRVADFCDEGQRALVGTTYQELTGDWTNSTEIAPTQSLGMALHRVPKLEGFVFPSSRAGGKILVIFPDKLDPRRSLITFRNDLSGESERLT